MASRRLHYIDWLRVLAVLLLFPFHTTRLFNAGEPFYAKAPELSTATGRVLSFIDGWHMPLLFFLAGASTYLALGRRSRRQYATERIRRLLVPFLFGVLILIPPQTWYGGRVNSGYQESYLHYLASGDFLEWNIKDGGDYYGGFGIGHLWFIIVLFVIALALLPLLVRDHHRPGALARLGRWLSHPAGWLLAGLIIFLAEGLPAAAGKNVFYYLVFFLFGYLAMRTPRFMEVAERFRWAAITAGVGVGIWWTASWQLRDSLADPSLGLTAVNLAGMTGRWLVIVGLLGLGRRYLDRPSPALAYLAEGSYPVYILHQTAIVIIGFYVIRLDAAWPVQWVVLLAAGVAATFAAYEGVRRVPWLRTLFGMRPARASARPAVRRPRPISPAPG